MIHQRLPRNSFDAQISLPRHPAAEDLEDGDRIQIGQDVWRVLGSLLLQSGFWMFRLEPVHVGRDTPDGPARLLVPALAPADGAVPLWTLVLNGTPQELPADLFTIHSEVTEVIFHP
ncbi:MAG TPA: hypothetical protein VHN15_03580 [Thermoanaerobaculia bacterium]|nr:hypothetical protein [Thermoanaerobaculia bacterium]